MRQYNIIAFSILFILSNKICLAQEIGIRGGFNLSQFWWEYYDTKGPLEGTQLNPGFNIGPVLELPVTRLFSFETGLLFTTRGYKSSVVVNDILNDERTTLFYLEVPVLCKITVPVKKVGIFAMAGLYFGEALYGKVEWTDHSVTGKWEGDVHWGDEPGELDRFDYGLKFGAGLRYNRWQIGASYGLGLKNISNMNEFPYEVTKKNRVMEFYILYTLTNLKSNKK